MNANDVIESYVTDVAVHLPRKQRNDVALELRSLLNEGLQDKAEAAGRVVDAGLALEFVNAFGRPVDVAARYRPTLTIIDPADGHAFLRASIIGLAIIWGAGLLTYFRQPIDSGWDFLTALGQFWGSALIPSMWWPGVLVVGYGLASWSRRRNPQTSAWKPRAGDRVEGGRASMGMGLLGMLLGLAVLIDPGWILEILFGRGLAPAAYEALTYTDTFRQRQAPFLFGLLLLYIPILATVIVSGRWSMTMRRVQMGVSLAICAVLVWTAFDGPVFRAQSGERAVDSALVLIVVYMLITAVVEMRRTVRPSPNQRIQA